MKYLYPIEIHGLFIAPEHRVFGQGENDLRGGDLVSKSQVSLIAHSGIKGDRFFRYRPEYNGHVTFFSLEVWDEVVEALDLPNTMGPELTRRNVIISGIDLKALYGQSFEVGGIQFAGTKHCALCPAMNRAIGPGATLALRGRGGLRAQVKSDGEIKLGRTELSTGIKLDPQNAAAPASSPKLP